ncbi:MAG: hypothetical protein QNK23_16870 [Crocinitomicaceae bacterium]|nr:hypothetical protein [Crocinitomicaceae bacterium]
MKRTNSKIASSSLGYAISFLLLIGLVCSGVLFITSVNKRIQVGHELDQHMLFNNYFGLRYGASTNQVGEQNIVHTSGDTSLIIVKNWGAFKVVVSSTFHGSRNVEKSALFGQQTPYKLPVLYVPEHNQEIQLCGDTRIEGTVYRSKRGFERGYIGGQHFTGEELVDGKEYQSEKTLPALTIALDQFDLAQFSSSATRLESLMNDSSFSFTEPTSLLSSTDGLQVSNHFEGNLVLHSFDSIFVRASAQLVNVILIAPVIRFEAGFQGKVQAIAEIRITCEENVYLDYPSALILREVENLNPQIQSTIYLDQGTRVLGGILLTSEHPNFRSPVHLELNEALVAGLVYNQGETELQGKIIGSLYTNQFSLNAGGGQYTNALLNATLSNKLLPKDFVMPDWIDHEGISTPTLLSCF